MITLMVVLWVKTGNRLVSEVGTIFRGAGTYTGGSFSAFMGVVGTMVAYYAAVILNYGDFTRYVRSERDMKIGNLLGLPPNVAFFSFIALFVTAGTAAVFGDRMTDPTEIVKRIDYLPLTIVAALTFFAATVGINVVANFVPPANDFSNLFPSRISFRVGGLIASCVALVIGAFWVSVISQFGISKFVNTLGALLAPAYGIMIADFYVTKGQNLDVAQLYSSASTGAYYYRKGWNSEALLALVLASAFSIVAVWLPALGFLSGFDWLIGALLGGCLYVGLARRAAAIGAAR
jgi:NCS1 family nucleobase:cation symporter-1